MIRALIGRVLGWLCVRYAPGLSKLTRTITAGASPYLTKYLLAGMAKGGGHLHLHRFHRGDHSAEHHTHKWYGWGIVLARGYREHRIDVLARRTVRDCGPLSIVRIRPETAHRIDLLPGTGDCWTLFWNGPEVTDEWGFVDPETNEYTSEEVFHRRRGLQRIAEVDE